jgi:hypothetical protein
MPENLRRIALRTTLAANPSVADVSSPPGGNGYLLPGSAALGDDQCGGAGTWGQSSCGVDRVNGNPGACPKGRRLRYEARRREARSLGLYAGDAASAAL